MGRNIKPGISFYRMDAGHILNKKVRLLYNDHGSDGYFIWCCLLDYAYKEHGYYFDMNDRDGLDLFSTDYCRKPLELINAVIASATKRELFDATIAEKYGILTAEMMQDVFVFATSERRKKGSQFEMNADWMCIDHDPIRMANINIIRGSKPIVPGKNVIVPGKMPIVPGNNPQTETETETKTEMLGAVITATHTKSSNDPGSNTPEPVQKTESPQKRNAGAKNVDKTMPPQYVDVLAYFMKQYNPQNPGTWFPDFCALQAQKFWNHYTANGWRQGKGTGRPIKQWRGAAGNWIINTKTGSFDDSGRNGGGSGSPAPNRPQPRQTTRELPAMDREINYLFARYCDDPSTTTYYGMETGYYDRLKQSGKISFTDDAVAEIKTMALKECTDKQIEPTESIMVAYMKKIGVIEFFKQCKHECKTEIFHQP